MMLLLAMLLPDYGGPTLLQPKSTQSAASRCHETYGVFGNYQSAWRATFSEKGR